jgi:hypothetical protein
MTAETRRRLLLIVAALFTAWAVWQVSDVDDPTVRPAASRRTASVGSGAGTPVDLGSAMNLPVRVAATEPVRDLFQLPQPPAPPPTQAKAPTAPPLPFSYLGGLSEGGETQIFLSDGTNMVVAKPGSRLAGGWILESVAPGQAVFNYEALQQRQTLATGGRW